VNEVIAQLQAQVDNIATGEDVDQINESINQVELDIEELLASNNKPLLDPQTKTYEKVSAWSWLVKPFAKGVYSNVVEVGGIKKIIDSP